MSTSNDVGHALRRMLREGRDVERCAAARALGAMRCEKAVEALIERLRDEDEDVRVDAAEALAVIASPRAGAALLESLVQDPVSEVKIAAVAALGHLRDGAAIPVLRELVRGSEGRVVWDEEEFRDGGWSDWLDVQVAAITALGEMGAVEAVPDIVASVADEMGQDVEQVAFRALAKLEPDGRDALAAMLRRGAERQRGRAAEALRESGSRVARETLALALDDPCADIRGTALSALAARNSGDARLAALLGDADSGVRAAAVRLVGRHWPERLDELLDDPGEQVQAEVLGLLSDNRGLAQPKNFEFRLRVKMRGPSEQVAAVACRAFAGLAPKSALADLREQLHDGKCPAPVRRAAARALAMLGSARAVEALSGALDDDHREVRTETIAALARVARNGPARKSAIRVLMGALRGEAVAPPENAMTETRLASPPPLPNNMEEEGASAEGGDDWPKSTLRAITGGDSDSDARPTIPRPVELDEKELELLALAAIRPRKKHVSLNPPVILLEDVRRLAARVLGDIALVEVAEALAGELDAEDLELRRAAADSLARVGAGLGGLPPGVREALLGCSEDPDRDLRLVATRALGTTSKDAASALTARLGDDDGLVRAEAARSLAALGTAPGELPGLLSDAYPGVRLAAARAIAGQGGARALAQLVAFAFAHQGMHATEVAGLLRDVDRDGASARLLATLGDPGQREKWRIAIDILKELHRSGGEATPRMVA